MFPLLHHKPHCVTCASLLASYLNYIVEGLWGNAFHWCMVEVLLPCDLLSVHVWWSLHCDMALLTTSPRVRLDGIQSELKKPAQYKVSIVLSHVLHLSASKSWMCGMVTKCHSSSAWYYCPHPVWHLTSTLAAQVNDLVASGLTGASCDLLYTHSGVVFIHHTTPEDWSVSKRLSC